MYFHNCTQSEPRLELLGPSGALKKLQRLLRRFVDLRKRGGPSGIFGEPSGTFGHLQGNVGARDLRGPSDLLGTVGERSGTFVGSSGAFGNLLGTSGDPSTSDNGSKIRISTPTRCQKLSFWAICTAQRDSANETGLDPNIKAWDQYNYTYLGYNTVWDQEGSHW